MKRWSLVWILALCPLAARAADAPRTLHAGFGATDITPRVDAEHPVWLAGYGPGRRATGVHDPLYARALVLQHGDEKLALVSVDLVGLQYPTILRVRAALPDFRYVLVSSTHNHEGPDVIGIWGRSLLQRGVNDRYLDDVIERIVSAVREAEQTAAPSSVKFGTAEDGTLLRDSRRPVVKDGMLRALHFLEPQSGRSQGIVVQWACHPEALGSRNTQITADFPASTISTLRGEFGCPVIYMAGAVGGLMAPPRDRIHDEDGQPLSDGSFEYAQRYGAEVARLTQRALGSATPLMLTPFLVSTKPIAVPIENVWYRTARALGVLRRQGRIWTGDFEKLGDLINPMNADQPSAIETEVAYLRLGELHVAGIPGEIYPELVYGQFEDPAQPHADFPEAPLEPTVDAVMPGRKWMLFGLANDEIGYIIPRRQWDREAPFAYGRHTPQYGEINSCGPLTAPIIMGALSNRVREAGK